MIESLVADRPLAVAVVITHNNAGTISRCLQALLQATLASRMQWNVIVVDNASNDETVTLLLDGQPGFPLDIQLIRNTTNRGFAAGVNQAVAASRGACILLLNPDCFISTDALAAVESAQRQHPKDGFVVQLYNVDGSVQPSAGYLPWPGRLLRRKLTFQRRGTMLNDGGLELLIEARAVEWAHFAFFFIKRQTWLNLGGLDERFWLFGEDLDFCYRLRAHGGAIWWLPEGSAVHIGGHSTSGNQSEAHRQARTAHALFVALHGTWLQRALLLTAVPYFRVAEVWRRRGARNVDEGRSALIPPDPTNHVLRR